ncbi:MAG: glycoside hydrolase family 3 C-terminal domain-containing protein [Anaerolineae bacterium]|nr:glycoside hydrolase family 3 C-terminal domain-containing protein [Anaerolineae bacterium]
MYKEPSLPIEARVADLVSRMTLEEKVSQMVYDAPAIERLGIPQYNWWNECLHGVGRAGVATVFPQAIGLAATWNPDLLHRIAVAISDEARAKHHEAVRRGIREIYTGLTFWSPNINIFRDPRWGRGQETYGEDPYLTARMGVAFVKGLQGDDPRYLKLVATPKHYAVHSGPELERHHFDAQVSGRDMGETYLPAFEACVKEAKAASVMGAYNRVNGEPCCASPTLLEKILRREWGFEGYVVSDCWAIRDIYAHHQVVDTPEAAAALAVKNGCDLNCGSTYPALLEAVKQGLISEEEIDQAVTRLFIARFRLGMFDPPEQVPYAQIPYQVVDSPQHRELALQAARESIVLLKNEGNLLPLPKDLGSIAVIGPNADDLRVLLGNYSGTPTRAVAPLEGIRRKVSPATRLYYAQGCAIADGVPTLEVIPSTYLHPTDADAQERGLRADYYDNPGFEGEPVLSRVDRIVDFIWKDTTPLTGRWGDSFAVRWTGYLVPPVSGTYGLGVNGFSEYRLYLDGELIAEYKGVHHPILGRKEVELEAGRLYSLRLDYVSRGLDPQVQLLWSLPGADHEAQALEAARKAEVIIAVMGISPALEGEEMPVKVDGFAGGDRTDIRLPRPQEELLKQIHALGKPVVLVLLNGSALAVNWAAEHIPAIVEAWYPGQAGGEAIADVLFGDYNPAGRLPVTFYKSVEDLPPFEDYRLEGRTYRYFRGEPLFPFGYGLSYTTFEFENLCIAPQKVAVGDRVTISVDVTNTGSRAGDEVVQLYVRHCDVPPPCPLKELKGFKRLSLQPGERKTVTFTLHTHQLGLCDEAMRYVVRPGVIEVMVGNASNHLPLTGTLEITGRAVDVSREKVFFSDVTVTAQAEQQGAG